MADQPSAPAPNTPAAPAAAPSQQSVTVVDPSTAGRTLAQLRTDRREALTKGAAPADPKATSLTPSTAASPAAVGGAAAPTDRTTTPSADDDEISVLIEAQRAQKDAAKALDSRKGELDAREAALKEHETHIPAIVAAREAMKAGNIMGALHAVFGKELITRDVFWAISKHIDEHGEEGAPAPVDTKAEFERLYQERQAAEKAEADKKTATAREALLQARDSHDAALGTGFGAGIMGVVKTVQVGGRDLPLASAPPEVLGSVVAGFATYVQTAMAEFARDAAKYPAIAQFKPPVLRLVEVVERLRGGKDGAVPSTTAALQAVEAELAATIRATPYAAQQAAPGRPPTSINGSWQRDEGSPPPAEGHQTVDQKREAMRARLRNRATA